MTGLTSHVLDTMHGCPAVGMAVRLFVDGDLLSACVTDADGRCEALLLDAPLRPGRYRLEFGVGAYFAGKGLAPADPPFLDVVPVEFGVANEEAHHHVPLFVSPYAYSTFRSS